MPRLDVDRLITTALAAPPTWQAATSEGRTVQAPVVKTPVRDVCTVAAAPVFGLVFGFAAHDLNVHGGLHSVGDLAGFLLGAGGSFALAMKSAHERVQAMAFGLAATLGAAGAMVYSSRFAVSVILEGIAVAASSFKVADIFEGRSQRRELAHQQRTTAQDKLGSKRQMNLDTQTHKTVRKLIDLAGDYEATERAEAETQRLIHAYPESFPSAAQLQQPRGEQIEAAPSSSWPQLPRPRRAADDVVLSTTYTRDYDQEENR